MRLLLAAEERRKAAEEQSRKAAEEERKAFEEQISNELFGAFGTDLAENRLVNYSSLLSFHYHIIIILLKLSYNYSLNML